MTKTQKPIIAKNEAATVKHISILRKAAAESPFNVSQEERPFVLELEDAGMLKLVDFGNHAHLLIVSSITINGRAYLLDLLSREADRSFLRSVWRALLAFCAAVVAASQVVMAVLDLLRFLRGS